MSNDFKLVPDENRTFTTSEIKNAMGCTKTLILAYAKKKGFRPLNDGNMKNGISGIWSFEFYKSFSAYLQSLRERQNYYEEQRKKKAAKSEKDISLEELKRLHPLVTDERCFHLNWWPDTVPANLKEYTD